MNGLILLGWTAFFMNVVACTLLFIMRNPVGLLNLAIALVVLRDLKRLHK